MRIIFCAEFILFVPGDVTDENAKWIMVNLQYSATPLYSGESGGWTGESETQFSVEYVWLWSAIVHAGVEASGQCPVSNSGHLAQTKLATY